MEHILLNNGVKIPLLGFGTYLLRDGSECEQSVLHALNIGYRLIDTAAAYHMRHRWEEPLRKVISDGKKFL